MDRELLLVDRKQIKRSEHTLPQQNIIPRKFAFLNLTKKIIVGTHVNSPVLKTFFQVQLCHLNFSTHLIGSNKKFFQFISIFLKSSILTYVFRHFFTSVLF